MGSVGWLKQTGRHSYFDSLITLGQLLLNRELSKFSVATRRTFALAQNPNIKPSADII
jgi:hypothetical protein